MGQGFFGYNPPNFILDAAKQALDRVECNQYSPTRGRPRLLRAIAEAYSPSWGRKIDPETEVTVTTGANEGELGRVSEAGWCKRERDAGDACMRECGVLSDVHGLRVSVYT